MMFGMTNVRHPLTTKTAPDSTNMELQCASSKSPAMFPPTSEPVGLKIKAVVKISSDDVNSYLSGPS